MSFLWKRLEYCCFCLRLRVGTLIILWLALIISIIYVIDVVFIYPELLPVTRGTIAVISVILGVFPPAVGLYGAYQNEPEYLMPFIVVAVIQIICSIVSVIIVTFLWITCPKIIIDFAKKQAAETRSPQFIKEGAAKFVLVYNFINIVGSLFIWYFTNVVRSFYLQLIDESHVSNASSSNIPPTSHEHTVK